LSAIAGAQGGQGYWLLGADGAVQRRARSPRQVTAADMCWPPRSGPPPPQPGQATPWPSWVRRPNRHAPTSALLP
jgi:hypothetical protein